MSLRCTHHGSLTSPSSACVLRALCIHEQQLGWEKEDSSSEEEANPRKPAAVTVYELINSVSGSAVLLELGWMEHGTLRAGGAVRLHVLGLFMCTRSHTTSSNRSINVLCCCCTLANRQVTLVQAPELHRSMHLLLLN